MFSFLHKPVRIEPLVVFRMLFGFMMLFSTVRFMTLGWIDEHYIQPLFHFRYFGFEWIPIGPAWVIYAAHIIMLISSIGILLGAWYRFSALLFFLSFTYTELIDITYYLNHYYFVSLVSLLLIFLPAHHYFSIDVWRKVVNAQDTIPFWAPFLIKFQLFIVYFFAGIAKINSDWLFHALPLKIWLPANDTLPIIGSLFTLPAIPYVFSWAGMLFDTTIVFFLLWPKTRIIAYISVVFFHAVTGILFQIGVFPLVMIASTPIFFSDSFHQKVIEKIRVRLSSVLKKDYFTAPEIKLNAHCGNPYVAKQEAIKNNDFTFYSKRYEKPHTKKLATGLVLIYIGFQLVYPLRFLLYPGNLYWTEQGYRFSWRVMLVEKSGSATFYVKDAETGKEGLVHNPDFLNRHQEKQLSFQPDMILQYAHFLADYYKNRGVSNPEVRAEIYVTLNARPSQLYIDSTVNLAAISDSWANKNWILPFKP